MLPVAYRVIRGLATFFGVLGIIACICGIIAGIICNPELKKVNQITQATTLTSTSRQINNTII